MPSSCAPPSNNYFEQAQPHHYYKASAKTFAIFNWKCDRSIGNVFVAISSVRFNVALCVTGATTELSVVSGSIQFGGVIKVSPAQTGVGKQKEIEVTYR